MRCIVTAGPTFEPLDQVRRLTNFSTGRLGSELVNFLADHGHEVTLLIGQAATWRAHRQAKAVETFTTTADLGQRLAALAGPAMEAVFHAAAVSDFRFGKIWQRSNSSDLTEVQSGKIATSAGALLAELVPTPKLIGQLRSWFPQARIIGWKYEVDGERDRVMALAREQINSNRTDACVANGPAYGAGFGLVTLDAIRDLPTAAELFASLESFARSA